MGIKAVAFDYGGVISYPPSQEEQAELERLSGIPRQKLWELSRKHRSLLDRGTYNSYEFMKYILSIEEVHPDEKTLEELTRIEMGSWQRINSGTVTLMRDVKATGLLLGILSNMPHDFLAWTRKNVPVVNEASTAVFSCDFSLVKPEEGIYEVLKNSLNCEYREIVFFDDLPDNIEKAKELGIAGFVWEGPQEARKILKSFGGELSEI